MPKPTGARVRLPEPEHRDPLRQAGIRVLLGVAVIIFVMVLVLLQRGGYEDAAGGGITVIDALYYSTVSVTTVGYGDISPVTQSARLLNALLVTPARVIFLILLVGSVFELATGSLRTRIREGRWRAGLKNHFIVVGFGVKGKSAVRVLLGRGVPRDRILIIDRNRQSVEEAAAAGLVAIPGDAARTSVLEEAGIGAAQASWWPPTPTRPRCS
jgi:voltage-gated potassium channel